MKNVSSVTARVAIVTGLFVGAFALAALADWTKPVSAPPSCASGDPGCDAPINVGGTIGVASSGQYKKGPLGLGATSGLTDGISLNVFGTAVMTNLLAGTAGIGTISPDPATKLDVENGPIKAGGGLIIQVSAGTPSGSLQTGRMWLVQ